MFLWPIGLIMFWFRPYYTFVLVFALGVTILGSAIYMMGTTPEAAAEYIVAIILGNLVFAAVGCVEVFIRKRMKAGRIAKDKRREAAEMETIRAEIAARNAVRPPAP
jgi:hypothetical protein